MKKIAVFVSGSGSDMQSVIDACNSGGINGKVIYVVANKSGIFALERAAREGIEHGVFAQKDYGGAEERDRAILSELNSRGIDLAVLAGYLNIVSPCITEAYKGRIINVHPSLIPKHCGMGLYGMRVHESVIKAGDKISGCTVHYVDEGADTGEIIAQSCVKVAEDDTAETLQKKVLKEEHILLPKVVAELCAK